MKTKYFFLAAIAGMTLVSCSNDEYIGDNSPTLGEGDGAIQFSYNVANATRANNDHATSALNLGNQFIVWGEKSEPNDGTAGTAVFTNYQVNYTASTAYTTTSNTLDWEYVGYTHSAAYQSSIYPYLTAAQTIKYWDYSATNYTFTAVSAKQDDITAGNVVITKKTTDDDDTDGEDVYGKGYTVTIDKDADLTKLYFADRVPVAQSAGTNRHAVNTYGGNVTLTFRNAQSQIRVGMYETISGYSVKIKKFYYKSDGAPADFAAMTTAGADNKFYANVPNIKKPTDASTLTFNVTYQKSGTLLNQPIIAPTGSANQVLTLGTNVKDATTLGTSAYNATFDQTGAYAAAPYTLVFPQEGNTTNLKLKIDYTLTSLDGSGETIEIEGATAEIPAEFLTWKPNYKYTYLFKISENTNGSSGQGVVGLYPITFDAVQVVDGDGLAEYITTVSEPSITTFGVKGGKYTTVGSTYDYPAAADVYAVVENNSGLATLSGTETKIYEVSTSDATNFPITEASFAEALIEGPTLTAAEAANAKITYVAGPALTFQNTVPAEDGTTIELDPSANKAAKFTTVGATPAKTYAIVYQVTAATYTVDGGQTYDAAAFAAAGTLYTTAECTTVATSSYYSAHTDATYYKRTAVSNKGQYVVKIIKVEAGS
ncbi:MAG: hypothetical protein IJ895_00270 [Prevotella sp.]|nr:hypothetical protein [Prevotella sp.]